MSTCGSWPRTGPSSLAALVFLAISTELTATLMLSPIGTSTLATEFWSASSELRYGAAAPYALLLVLVFNVLGISLVTNLAAGISPVPLSHAEVIEAGQAAGPRISALLAEIVKKV